MTKMNHYVVGRSGVSRFIHPSYLKPGDAVIKTHEPSKCAGSECVLHNPSAHHMISWPALWRWDRGIVERVCEHGIGHPDPDSVSYSTSIGDGSVAVHGCDGCCAPQDSNCSVCGEQINHDSLWPCESCGASRRERLEMEE